MPQFADVRSGRRSCELRMSRRVRGQRLGLMQIRRRVDYGLRAIIYLSLQEPEKYCSINEMATLYEVPKEFLEEIIQNLIRCGLIKSKRGACRGYTLARPLEQISFYDVIEAIEGVTAHRNERLGCHKLVHARTL
jgi:Rrf2 family protein